MKQYNDLIKVVKEGPINYDMDRKDELRRKSTAFLRKLTKDLGITEKEIYFNPAGPAVSGEATLRGMWSEGNGIYINIDDSNFMFREIKKVRDYSGGSNNFIWSSWNKNLDIPYEEVVKRLLRLKKQ